ncbi:MAG: hypothetical protein ABIP96_00705 [Patescibacteria group bacterium]
MCGGYSSNSRLSGSGVLNSVPGKAWLSIADELAELPDADFEKVLHAFRLIRHAKAEEKKIEAALSKPLRRQRVR